MRMLPAPVQRWMTILLPPVCLLVACFVMVPRQSKLRQVNRNIRATQASIADYLVKLDAIRNLPPEPKIATLPMTKEEQSDFLRGLQVLCDRTGNRIMTISSLAAPQAPPPAASPSSSGSGQAASTEPKLPPDVIEIKSTVMFEGTFASLRSLLTGLQQTRRMISLSECKVTPVQDGYPLLNSSLTISRYVDAPPGWAPAQPPGGGNKPAGSGGPTT